MLLNLNSCFQQYFLQRLSEANPERYLGCIYMYLWKCATVPMFKRYLNSCCEIVTFMNIKEDDNSGALEIYPLP